MTARRVQTIILAALIAAIGIFYAATMRDGQYFWIDDFTTYISHARNIANGHNYKDTGYLYNPNYPVMGPSTYPPVFPLLLAPVYAFFGLNLTAMKAEMIVIFIAALAVIVVTVGRRLPFFHRAVLTAVIGLNPYFWDFKDYILSEFPFLLILFLALWSIHRTPEPDRSRAEQLLSACATGLLMYLAYGTRSVGIVLLPCLIVHQIIARKRLTRYAVISICIFIGLAALQAYFLHSDHAYTDQLQIHPVMIVTNALGYIQSLSLLWANAHSILMNRLVYSFMSLLAVAGIVAAIKKGVTVYEIFAGIYGAFIILWPTYMGIRYLIPIIPLYIYYALRGTLSFPERWKLERPLIAFFLCSIVVSYLGVYATVEYDRFKGGVEKKESVEMFEYVKNHTDAADVIIFRKPRVLALYSGRTSSMYHETPSDDDLISYLHGINASYIVTSAMDYPYFTAFMKKYQEQLFEEVFHNSDFSVFRIRWAGRNMNRVQ